MLELTGMFGYAAVVGLPYRRYIAGTTTMLSSVDVTSPHRMTIAIGVWISLPAFPDTFAKTPERRQIIAEHLDRDVRAGAGEHVIDPVRYGPHVHTAWPTDTSGRQAGARQANSGETGGRVAMRPACAGWSVRWCGIIERQRAIAHDSGICRNHRCSGNRDC